MTNKKKKRVIKKATKKTRVISKKNTARKKKVVKKKTRKANLILLLLTTFSWFILGIWYGFGFCPCAEWHYQVRVKLGHTDMPSSWIKFCIDYLTGWDVNASLVDILTLTLFLAALTASIYMNIKDRKTGKK